MTGPSEEQDAFDEFVNDVISASPKVEESKTRHRAISTGSIRLISADQYVSPNLRVVETLPMITARCAIGMNVFKDMAVAVRDAVGGRSRTLENAIENAELAVINDLKQQAAQFGAQAVISVRFQTTDLVGKGVCVVAYGTPVKLETAHES
jgi:uncharacterized protein YbjQ (UPF0145 family)